MFLRYHFGHGVGHVYSHMSRFSQASSSQPVPSQPDNLHADVDQPLSFLDTIHSSTTQQPLSVTEAVYPDRARTVAPDGQHGHIFEHLVGGQHIHSIGSQPNSNSSSDSGSSSDLNFDNEDEDEDDGVEDKSLSDIGDEELFAEEMYA